MKKITVLASLQFCLVLCSCQTTIYTPEKREDRIEQNTEWHIQDDTDMVYIKKLKPADKLEIRVEIPIPEAEEADSDDITFLVYDSLAKYLKVKADERMIAPGLVCEKSFDKNGKSVFIYTIPLPQKVKK